MKLREYQDELSTKAAYRLQAFGLCYLAMECRTGKTLTALAAADKYRASSVLFVTKKKAIASVQKDFEAYKPAFDLTVTNYESAHKITGFFDFVVLDEAHNLGAFPRPVKKQQNLRRLCGSLPILFLSGTPSPESYSQLYHQFQVSSFSPWRSYKNFYFWAKAGFVSVVPKMVNGHILNDYSKANEARVKADIQPLLLTYTQEEAGFESHISEEDLFVTMKPETGELFEELQRNKIARTRNGGLFVLGDTPAALLNKLHQISGGTVITEEGKAVVLDRSKAEAIKDRFNGKKIAVFYTYQAEGDLLKETFERWTDSPRRGKAGHLRSHCFLFPGILIFEL